MALKNIYQLPKRRRCSRSASPFLVSVLCTCKLLIFLVVALGDRTWVRAQTDYSQCYSDLYTADQNGDGRVDAAEYVEFSHLRLEERLQLHPDGHTYDPSSAGITTFILLPASLQSNFYTLACLCSRFDFDDAIADKGSCCIGDNAHISVRSDGSTEGMEEEEVRYTNIVCNFSDRAIDSVITTLDKIETTSPKPTNVPSPSPSVRTGQPTRSPITSAPTARPSLRTVQPTLTPMPSIEATTTTSGESSSLAPVAETVQPTNITIKTSYSILAEENVPVKDIHNDCIEGMDKLTRQVAAELWYNEEDIVLEESPFHDRLFVELPTSIDKIEEMGFTSTPFLDEIDGDAVFVIGPCPSEMEFGSDGSQYKCFQVTASIILKVTIDDSLMEEGITADDVEDLYTDALEEKILQGDLATVHEELLPDSSVIMATGQIVTVPERRRPLWVIAVVVLVLVILYFIIFHRKKRKIRENERETVASPKEDLEARNSPSPKSSSGSGKAKNISDSGIQYKQTVPYFQQDPSPITGAEDTKSLGGISAESDAGWSEAYTSSMGSVSDDGILESPTRIQTPDRPEMVSLSLGPTAAPSEAEDNSEVSPMKESEPPAIPSLPTPTSPSSPDNQTAISPISPVTPKSLQVLDESSSDKEDDIMVHEDFSDEDESGDKKNGIESPQKQKESPANDKKGKDESPKKQEESPVDDKTDGDESPKKEKESPEEFRARVHDLVQRIVPEEIDQIDTMIAEFKHREEELVQTLLTMEKRAKAQKQEADTTNP